METRQQQFRRSRMALMVSLAVGATGVCSLATPVWAQQPGAEQSAALATYDIPAQALSSAVLAFARQSGVEVLYDAQRLAGLQSIAVQGQYGARQALQQLLGGAPVTQQFSADGRQVRLSRQSTEALQASLPTILVEGNLDTRGQPYREPRSVAVIDAEQIDRVPARHAADLLEQTAGIYTAVSQQDPGLSVNIRGVQDYGRVNMSIDGMRQNYQQSGHQQRNGTMYIDPELLAGVTVEKGASSGMGGAGVIGGIANFRTLDARDFIDEDAGFGGRLRASTGLGGYANGTDFIGSSVFAFGNELGDLLFAASERHLGDYKPGQRGGIGERRTGAGFNPEVADRVKASDIRYSRSTMRSRLLKGGLNLPDDQRLQLSYLRTQVSYEDANMLNVSTDELWEHLGSSNIVSQSLALDYLYTPDSHLIDLAAKLYYVDSVNDQDTLARGISQAFSTRYRTQTYGVQLQNSSTLLVGDDGSVLANYGVEMFYDRVSPDSDQAVAGSSAVDYPYAEGMTPSGSRAMGSLFASLDYEYGDWLSLSAGLRYDRYRLRGETGMNTRTFYLDGSNQHYNVPLLFDVDREEGRFSPTFGIAVKPGVDWLQLFASYGKGWRPPAVTETLVSGRPHGGGAETLYPNPFIKPERSSAFELGFNVLREGLLTERDRLGIKVAYFDTRIEDFMYLGYNLRRPGYSPIATLGTTAYVNNLATTRFRGVEYSLDYDAGAVYGNLSYTHMIGDNDYCKRTAWLGGVESTVEGVGGRRPPIIGMEPDLAANAMINCGGMMGSAEHMPMDRGSLTLGSRWLQRTLDVGLRVRYSEGYWLESGDPAGNNMTYPADWKPYTVFDLYGSYDVSDALTVRMSVENLRDRAYMVPLGDVLAFTLGRGRTVQGTLEYRF